MKTFLILVFLFSAMELLLTQEWQVGATWVYEQDDFNTPDTTNFVIFKITGDTIIQNQSAKILREYPSYHSNKPFNAQNNFFTYYLKTENQKVSLWVKDSSKFLEIYNFNLQEGDSVKWYVGSSYIDRLLPLTINYVISNVEFLQISGLSKRKYQLENIESRWCYHFRDDIIEDIGCIGYLFQILCAADPSPGGKLRCFSNGNFTYPEGARCDLPTGLNELIKSQPNSYPNPTSGIFSIRDLPWDEFSFELYNQLGHRLYYGFKKEKFDITNLPSGIYFLMLKGNQTSFRLSVCKW